MSFRLILLAVLALDWAMNAGAQGNACNQASANAISQIELPGRPFEPIPTADGCWIFVSLTNVSGGRPAIGVIHRSEGNLTVKRVVSVDSKGLSGMVLTHDGKLLIAGTGNGVLFLDPTDLISEKGDAVVGRMETSPATPTASYVNVTSDDGFLFVSNESSGTVSVINLRVAKQSRYSNQALVGTIPMGRAPIAVTLSPDDRYLYTTSELAPASYGWPPACKAEQPRGGSKGLQHPEGAIIVVDVNRAKTDPAGAIVGHVPSGCSPVRLVLSPNGDRAYVTARGDNALLVFDTAKLLTSSDHARLASIAVGEAPVGVAVVANGSKIIVANSNRFSRGAGNQNLSVIDSDAGAVTGKIPAGEFPRELRVTTDGHTLLLTNFLSKTLEMIDLARVP